MSGSRYKFNCLYLHSNSIRDLFINAINFFFLNSSSVLLFCMHNYIRWSYEFIQVCARESVKMFISDQSNWTVIKTMYKYVNFKNSIHFQLWEKKKSEFVTKNLRLWWWSFINNKCLSQCTKMVYVRL